MSWLVWITAKVAATPKGTCLQVKPSTDKVSQLADCAEPGTGKPLQSWAARKVLLVQGKNSIAQPCLAESAR